MENKNQATLSTKVLATLDTILNKMADVLDKSFEPDDAESMKLLREFRATMNSRRIWVKFISFNDENQETSNTIMKKVETLLIKQPSPSSNKPAAASFDETIFKGIKCKNNNPIPQVDLTSGLVNRR